MSVPKPRPPSAHSSIFVEVCVAPPGGKKARTQTATTRPNRTQAPLDIVAFARRVDDRRKDERRHDHPYQLIPIEERQAEKRRFGAIVDSGNKRRRQTAESRSAYQACVRFMLTPDVLRRSRALPFKRHRTLGPDRADRIAAEKAGQHHAGDADRGADDLMRSRSGAPSRATLAKPATIGHEKSEKAGARRTDDRDTVVPYRPCEHDRKDDRKKKRSPDSPAQIARDGRAPAAGCRPENHQHPHRHRDRDQHDRRIAAQ